MSHRTYRAAGTVALCLAATLFVLAAITWAYKWIALSGVAVAALVGTVLLIAAAALKDHQHWSEHHEKHGFWYEVTKDFVGPLVIAGAGLYFGFQLEKQRGLEAENQSKATILRQMMTGRNGPDVAFFTAVGEQLTTHLQHWAKLRQEIDLRKDATEETKNAMREEAVFDEEAIYFFYGMFRAARIDFLATKGYVLYPRIWMEVAFERLTQHVNDRFLGASEQDSQVSPQEQAALYQYFGASKAMYSRRSRHGTLTGPDLFNFVSNLDQHQQPDAARGPGDKTPGTAVLQKGFADFQKRLRHNQPNPNEVIAIFGAIEGLDDYAFNTLFADWYHKPTYKMPLDKLPDVAPPEFLPYPLETFHATNPNTADDEWKRQRERAWCVIVEVVPAELKQSKKKCTSAPTR